MEVLENHEKICVFTGHRVLEEDFSERRLKKAVQMAFKNGYFTFLNGMAMGFDMRAAEILLSYKRKYPQIKLIACIPCLGQEKYFSLKDKARYLKLLEKADENVVLSDHYFNGCMQARDRYMAKRASMMIAYCNRDTGGTAYTLRYFEKIHPDYAILRV